MERNKRDHVKTTGVTTNRVVEITRHWRLQRMRYGTPRGGLLGEICPEGHLIFPPRDICPACKNEARTLYQFSGKGEVYSFTTICEPTDAPEGYEGQTPYAIALVRLIEEGDGGQRIEGPLVTALLTDLDTSLPLTERVKIGQAVEMVTRKLRTDGEKGMIVYGYKFRPRLEPASVNFTQA